MRSCANLNGNGDEMKKFGKILLIILIVLVIFIGAIFTLRFINGKNSEKLSKMRENEALMNLYAGVDRTDPLQSKIEGVSVSAIKGDYINGYRLLPDEIMHDGAVVVFGGSEGSSNFAEAAIIAQRGYEVYSMYFFGRENQRPELLNVPIDFFEELYVYIDENAVNPEPFTLLGGSKGAELALLLAAKYPTLVDNVVLFAPASYVFQGLSYTDRTPHSSWMVKGEELPYIATVPESSVLGKFMLDLLLNKPMKLIDTYISAIKIAENKDEAAIPLGDVKANLLIFAGRQDQMWPSAAMGEMIRDNYAGNCDLHIFEDAGHLFLGPPVMRNIALGGTYEANESAKFESDAILFEKLERWTDDK